MGEVYGPVAESLYSARASAAKVALLVRSAEVGWSVVTGGGGRCQQAYSDVCEGKV